MSIIYSGQTIVNTTIDGSTPSSFNSGLRTVLISAGWSVAVDGTSTGIWSLSSAVTPQSLQANLWIRNASGGGASCILNATSITAANYNTSLQAGADSAMATGTGFVYNIICTGYYMYIVRAVTPCPLNQNFFMAVPYVPAGLSGLITSLIVATAGLSSGGVPTICTTGLFLGDVGADFSYVNGAGSGSTISGASKWHMSGVTSTTAPVWFDGSLEFYEPRIMAFQTNSSPGFVGLNVSPIYACGYMWDALVVNYSMPRGTAISYDGNSWTVFTESQNPGLMILSA